jgi:hypothetical protein
MQKQIILVVLGVTLIRQSNGYSLDHQHVHPPSHPQYDLPPPPPEQPAVVYAPPKPPGPVAPLCGCYQLGRCDESLRSFTDLVIRNRASQLVCGSKYELCCFKDDPWPAVTDEFAHILPCVPDNICRRHYGTVPTDLRDYGTIGQCPGLGAVRCLDGLEIQTQPQPEGPTHFVIPIIEHPSEVYQPPQEPHITTEIPTTYLPPTTVGSYNYPEPPPQVVYQPPQPQQELPPSTVYAPPQEEEEVIIPPVSYGPPTSFNYYAPSPTPTPPTSYGVPQGNPIGYPYTSRFGYPYGYKRYGGYYPGFGFRLRKYFGVGFLG